MLEVFRLSQPKQAIISLKLMAKQMLPLLPSPNYLPPFLNHIQNWCEMGDKNLKVQLLKHHSYVYITEHYARRHWNANNDVGRPTQCIAKCKKSDMLENYFMITFLFSNSFMWQKWEKKRMNYGWKEITKTLAVIIISGWWDFNFLNR